MIVGILMALCYLVMPCTRRLACPGNPYSESYPTGAAAGLFGWNFDALLEVV
jgi:hypothetical protein